MVTKTLLKVAGLAGLLALAACKSAAGPEVQYCNFDEASEATICVEAQVLQ